MHSVIILLGSLLILGLLVALKVNIGISIFASALFIAIFSRFNISQLGNALINTLIDKQTIYIILVVVVITYFADLMKVSHFLDEMVQAFSAFFPARIFIPLFSFIIGALPMPGGALVSAPLVEQGSKNFSLSAEHKTVLNFWFRHIGEPVSPLYPEMILASSILGVSISRIILVQWPISLLMFISGLIFLIPLIKAQKNTQLNKSFSAFSKMLISLFPIIIVVFLILLFHFSIIISTIVGILYIVAVKHPSLKDIIKAFNYKLLLKISFLMYAIFFLKYITAKSNIINSVYALMKTTHIPTLIILFFLPFLVSLMSGAASATVGISYSLLLPLLKTPNLNSLALFVAFLGGWSALMFTPTHLCLSLTVEYFDAHLNKVYSLLLKNIAFLIVFSLIFVFLYTI